MITKAWVEWVLIWKRDLLPFAFCFYLFIFLRAHLHTPCLSVAMVTKSNLRTVRFDSSQWEHPSRSPVPHASALFTSEQLQPEVKVSCRQHQMFGSDKTQQDCLENTLCHVPGSRMSSDLQRYNWDTRLKKDMASNVSF